MRTVGIAVLMADTGEKARALQHWSDLLIIRAEPDTDKQGRGRHREYLAEPFYGERKWALLAAALNSLRIPLGEVRKVVDMMRTYGEPRAENGESEQIALNKFQVSSFYAALTGRGPVWLMIGTSTHEGKPCLDISLTSTMTANSALGIEMVSDFMAKHKAACILNLTDVFAPLRR